VQRSRNVEKAQKLLFYVIEAQWLRRAWPILNGKIPASNDYGDNNIVGFKSDWREMVVRQISNSILLPPLEIIQQKDVNTAITNTDIDDDESMNDANDPPRQKQQPLQTQSSPAETLKKPKLKALQSNSNTAITMLQNHLPTRQQLQLQNQTTCTKDPSLLRNDVLIDVDYFLVGEYVWLLLKQKFGYDYEIKFSCTFLPPKESYDPPSLAVKVMLQHDDDSKKTKHKDHSMVKVPLTGRFAYEKTLGTISYHTSMAGNSRSVFENSSSLQIMSMSPRAAPIIGSTVCCLYQVVSLKISFFFK
jgi:hypothetical protein